MFNALTTGYLFLGGTGAGLCAALSALELANPRWRAPGAPVGRVARPFALPGEFFARAWPACLVILAAAVLCLGADLGRPDRLANLFTSPAFTPMSAGAWALAAALAVAGAFSATSLLDGWEPPGLGAALVAMAGIAVGAVTAAYTGVLFEALASVEAYQTPLVPIMFTLSSLSCGLACVFVILVFTESRHAYVGALARLGRADTVLVAAEVVAVAVYALWLWSGAGTRLGAEALVAGDLAPLFWGGLVLAGLVAPLVLERFLTYGNARTQLLWTAGCLLAGGLCLRLCAVGLAAFDVTQMPALMYGLVG
ncbi:MAG: polysulfide reductase NrfD [Eggerthellaceae bacterium]|nr:polysulfide reductase NrfD [Eggerthellaceae bacterium]